MQDVNISNSLHVNMFSESAVLLFLLGTPPPPLTESQTSSEETVFPSCLAVKYQEHPPHESLFSLHLHLKCQDFPDFTNQNPDRPYRGKNHRSTFDPHSPRRPLCPGVLSPHDRLCCPAELKTDVKVSSLDYLKLLTR